MLPDPLTDFAVSLAASLTEKLLASSANWLRKKFSAPEPRQALAASLQAGLQGALATLPPDPLIYQHFRDLFEPFLARPQVLGELGQLLDPRPQASLDLALLRDEFRASGFDPEALLVVDFDAFMVAFLNAFLEAAMAQPALQANFEIGLLRALAQATSAGVQAAGRTAEAAEQISVSSLRTAMAAEQTAATTQRAATAAEQTAVTTQRTADAAEQTAAATQRTAEGVEQATAVFTRLVEQILQGQAGGSQLAAATGQAVQQGFVSVVAALEALTGAVHAAGYTLNVQEAGTVVIGEHNQVEAGGPPAGLRLLLDEMTRLRQALQHSPQPTPAELEELRQRYNQHIIDWFERLTFQGMLRSARAISLPLEEVYVELRSVAEVPEAADAFSADERRLLLELKEGDDDDGKSRRELLRQFDALRKERWGRSHLERQSISAAFAHPEQRGLVILGDPGSGKSTLLHLLALVYARGPQVVQERLKLPAAEAERLPIYAPLAAFDDMRQANPQLSLVDFLAQYYDRRRGLPGLAPLFRQALEGGRALVLLDGLDELLTTTTRGYVAEQVAALVGEWSGRGNRFAITSRFVGYREAPIRGSLPHLSVLDFGESEIHTFIHQWARAYEKFAAGGQETPESLRLAAQAESDLRHDVASLPSVRRLAANPLMLTMLALLRRQVGRLPHRRIQLYQRYLDTLIENWVEARAPGARAGELERLDPHQATALLIPLAYWLQANQPSGTASGYALHEILTRICLEDEGYAPDTPERKARKQAEQQATRFLREMRQMNGLVVERGQDAFGFLHLTFQEYFAGRALAKMTPHERWQAARPHLHDPRWREPLLLCAGQLGVVEGRRKEASDFVRQVLDNEDDSEPELHRNLLLALAMAGDDINLEPGLVQEIAGRAAACLPTNVYALAKELVRGLGQLFATQAAGCEGCLDAVWAAEDWRLRQAAVEALSGFAEDGAIRGMLLPRLNDGDSDVRQAAAGVLAGTDPEVRLALLQCLDDDGWQVRQEAVNALAGLAGSDPEVRLALFQCLDDDSMWVQQAAMSALAGLAGSDLEVRLALLQCLDSGSSSVVRRTAASALGRLADSDDEVRSALLQRLDAPSWQARRVAASALVGLSSCDAEMRLALLQCLDDFDWDVRRSAASALAGLAGSDAEVCSALLQCLDDNVSVVQQAAADALAGLASTHPEIQAKLIAE